MSSSEEDIGAWGLSDAGPLSTRPALSAGRVHVLLFLF